MRWFYFSPLGPQESHLYSLIPRHPLAFKAPVHTLVATYVQILFTCLLLKCRLRSFHTIWLTALLTQLALDVFSMYILFLFLIIAIDFFTRYCQLYCVYVYIYIYIYIYIQVVNTYCLATGMSLCDLIFYTKFFLCSHSTFTHNCYHVFFTFSLS